MKITFITLNRILPFVVTDKGIECLSKKHGRDVRMELNRISQDIIPEKTYGKFLKYLEARLSISPAPIMNPTAISQE